MLELEETEYTDVFGRARWPGAPQRVLKTPFFAQLTTLPSDENETNQPIIGHSTIHDMVKTSTLVPGFLIQNFLFDSVSRINLRTLQKEKSLFLATIVTFFFNQTRKRVY